MGNLCGALAHLAADGVRGVAVLICGILAVAGVVDAAKADAYCSLFVCVFVLFATASLLRVVIRKSAPVAYESYEHVDLDSVGLQAARQKGPQPTTLGTPVNSGGA